MTLEQELVAALRERKQTVAVAESCTGGLLGHRLTNVPGSSAVFPGGILAYHNRPKRELLGVPAATLEQDGAVSAACAQAMATGVRNALGADFGIGITGVAGPGGGPPQKPSGTVFIALATAAGVHCEQHVFPGERLTYKLQATDAALRLVLASLD